jgi:hypothetical protein
MGIKRCVVIIGLMVLFCVLAVAQDKTQPQEKQPQEKQPDIKVTLKKATWVRVKFYEEIKQPRSLVERSELRIWPRFAWDKSLNIIAWGKLEIKEAKDDTGKNLIIDKPAFFPMKQRYKLGTLGTWYAAEEADSFDLWIRLASPDRKATKLIIFKAGIVLFGAKQIKAYKFTNLKTGQTLYHQDLKDISFKVVQVRKYRIGITPNGLGSARIYKMYLEKGEKKIRPTSLSGGGREPYTYWFTGKDVSEDMTFVAEIPEGEFEIPVNIEFKDIELP